MRENEGFKVDDDAMLIDDSILQSVIHAHREGVLELGESILCSEPVLSEFCCGRLLQIAGEMTLAGTPPGHVRSIAEQIHTLLSITGEAFRQAYVEMLKDFMPIDEPAPADPLPEAAPLETDAFLRSDSPDGDAPHL